MDEVIKQLERANQYWDEYYDYIREANEERYDNITETKTK